VIFSFSGAELSEARKTQISDIGKLVVVNDQNNFYVPSFAG